MMLKPTLLRQTLSNSVPYFRQHPDQLVIWVGKGSIISTGQQSRSFEYSYSCHVVAKDFPGSLDDLVVPTEIWIRRHQPDLVFNRKRRESGFSFESDIPSGDTVNISLHLQLTEAVMVKKEHGEISIKHLDEPEPPDLDTEWQLIIEEGVMV